MRKFKLAIVGVGHRGLSMIKSNLIHFENVEFVAICDLYEDRVAEAQAFIEEKRGYKPFGTTDYKEVFKRDDVECVYDFSESQSSDKRIIIYFNDSGKSAAVIFEGTARIAKLIASFCQNGASLKGEVLHG